MPIRIKKPFKNIKRKPKKKGRSKPNQQFTQSHPTLQPTPNPNGQKSSSISIQSKINGEIYETTCPAYIMNEEDPTLIIDEQNCKTVPLKLNPLKNTQSNQIAIAMGSSNPQPMKVASNNNSEDSDTDED